MIKKYCFYGPDYVGELHVYSEDHIEFHPVSSSTCKTDVARSWLDGTDWSNPRMIYYFISERHFDHRNPSYNFYVAQAGLPITCTDLEYFLANRGLYCNDIFWMDDEKSTEFWDKHFGPYTDKFKTPSFAEYTKQFEESLNRTKAL